jgi:hypothetical protein
MGRHLLARPTDYVYRDGTSPDRWLAAASGTNSAHLYLWEATREHKAGELSARFLGEVGAADALGQMRRFGVTHVVVTADDQSSVLRVTPGYHEVWREDDVVIFEVEAEPGLPAVEALLQPAQARMSDDADGAGEGEAADDDVGAADQDGAGSTTGGADAAGENAAGEDTEDLGATGPSLHAASRVQEAELVTWAVEASREMDVVAAVAHDPRWRVSVDGTRAAIERSDEGLVQFTLPPGRHDVELRYVGRTSDRWWLAVSLLSLVSAGLLVTGVSVPDRLPGRRRRSPEDDADDLDEDDDPGVEPAEASPRAL